MPDSVDSRSVILENIRRSLGQAESPAAIATEYSAILRTYTRSSALTSDKLLDLFADRLREYDAGVYQSKVGAISATIAEILSKRAKSTIAIPEGLSSEWLPDGFSFEAAQDYDKHQLDMLEGLLSGCTVAIAETGTIVLQNAGAQGPRILSLVPDYHLCVVFSDQIVGTVPEAFARLEATSNLPSTFISGPSATADIEMTRIKGVHGPRFLDVLIVIR